MSLKKLITRYSEYNENANKKIINWLSQDESILHVKTTSSYITLSHTVQHITQAQNFWFLFVTGYTVDDFDWSFVDLNFHSLRANLLNSSAQLEQICKTFNDAELLELQVLDMPWAKNSLSRYEYLLHAINHSSYHRGQIITMGRSLGLETDVPNTDYNMFRSV